LSTRARSIRSEGLFGRLVVSIFRSVTPVSLRTPELRITAPPRHQ
jgi:hypothetical protein